MSSAPTPSQIVEMDCDILVVGAGLGGCAAAIRAARLGRRVCLIEESGWPGGQISTQGVPHLDEHRYIETFGGTSTYYELRKAIRAHYRSAFNLVPAAQRDPFLNIGNAWVSRLSFEPRVGAAVLEELMAGPHDSGTLQVFYHTRAFLAEVYGGRVTSLLTRNSENGISIRFRAAFYLDATDLGDLFVLTGTAYEVGMESRAETGEPSAPIAPDRTCTQDYTYPVAVEFRPEEDHTIDKPPWYEVNRAQQPYSLVAQPRMPGAPAYRMFTTAPGTFGPFWTYRRVIDAQVFDDPRVPYDVSIINWPSNDYHGGTLVDQPPDVQARRRWEARQLTLGFLYWLQTEAPRDDGGRGYPELMPRPDVMGSADGLSQAPYIREGRRLRAKRTIREQDIAATSQPASRAARFDDTVGIGFYPIDIHGCGEVTQSIPTNPFQIPLGALVPEKTTNLLPAAKNIGTTHIANGAYRLHPVEWAVGDTAAVLAVMCQREGVTPQEVHASMEHTRRLQILLLDQGVPLYWYDDVPLDHPAFAASQLLAVVGIWEGDGETLRFSPAQRLTTAEGKRHVAATARGIQRWRGPEAADPGAAVLRPEPEDATLPLRWEAAITLATQAIPGTAAPPEAGRALELTRGDLAIWLGTLVRRAILEEPQDF